MPLYRRDRIEINESGQTLAFADWLFGPTLAAIGDVVCDDGQKRNAYITGEPSNAWAVPAYVSNGMNGKVKGYIECVNEDGCEVYKFRAYLVNDQPYKWLPVTRPIPPLTYRR
jgi:hypothetical protein